MSDTLKNIKKVALVFFIITGFLHLSSSIFIANQTFLKQAFVINKMMDIPFILTGLIYALSSLRISLSDPNKNFKILDISLISIIIVILVGILIVNLVIPNL